MTQQEFFDFQERNFDAFCKKTIRNLSAYALRTSINSEKRSRTLYDCLFQDVSNTAEEDNYHPYGRTFNVRGISLVVRDEAIGECLQFFPPNKRSVLLLSYFGDLSDSEIAKLLGISNATVSYRKKDALRRLRAMMEVMNRDK